MKKITTIEIYRLSPWIFPLGLLWGAVPVVVCLVVDGCIGSLLGAILCLIVALAASGIIVWKTKTHSWWTLKSSKEVEDETITP